MTNKEIIEFIKNCKHTKIKFAVPDIDGILRGKIISKDKFLEVAEGDLGFCDVIFGWDAGDQCYNNVKVTGWHTGYPDAKAHIDLQTFREIPWDDRLPFFIADFSNNENTGLSAVCPRNLLGKIRDRANMMGFTPVFSQEFEWFNFLGTPNELASKNYTSLQPISPGMFGYSMLRTSQYQDYFDDLFNLLEQFNVGLEGLHTETGPGVYEASIRYDEILNAADKAVLFKNSVKEIAYRHGIIASFMAKWNKNLPGCSGHIHQSLWNSNREKNLFYSKPADGQMSCMMEQYLAGILYCMPYVMPMYAPTVNSYKRLCEGAWAPTTVSWGYDNRTTAVRVINGSEASSRLEIRLPGSDSNPYLAMAASLASGLYGIQNKLKLNKHEVIGNAYKNKNLIRLPVNLTEANHKMETSKIAEELFSHDFVTHFCATRDWEWKEFNKAVTDWELKRYFEII